jgi:hypothetical protein
MEQDSKASSSHDNFKDSKKWENMQKNGIASMESTRRSMTTMKV